MRPPRRPMTGDGWSHALVPATAAWRAEMERRQAAYAERRRRWAQAWLSGTRPEPPTDGDANIARRGRTIHDKRQFRFPF